MTASRTIPKASGVAIMRTTMSGLVPIERNETGPGKSITVKFSHLGTFSYSCTIHPFMHGKIIVG